MTNSEAVSNGSLRAVQSTVAGRGCFSQREFAKGEIVFEFDGEIIDTEEVLRRQAQDGLRIDDPLQIDDRVWMLIGNIGLYINHSCDPNTVISGRATLIARRRIYPGDEITFDYSTSVSGKVPWSMECRCRCGAENCRAIVGNVLTVPEAQLDEYRRDNGLQTFIRRELGFE